MSHVIASQVFVGELQDARVVGEEKGFVLDENVTTFERYDNHDGAVCEHRLRRADYRPGMYDIGLCARTDGKPGWELKYDPWGYTAGMQGKAIEEKAGVGLCELKKGLAERAFVNGLPRGFRLQRDMDIRTGDITLRATRG